MIKCDHMSFTVRMKCPFYFAGLCTYKKLQADDNACRKKREGVKGCNT